MHNPISGMIDIKNTKGILIGMLSGRNLKSSY